MKICGPKCSLCFTILSVWGVIQLSVMAIMLYVRAPAFIEDIGIPADAEEDASEFLHALDKAYATAALNCGIAAGMYGITLIISGWQIMVNKRS